MKNMKFRRVLLLLFFLSDRFRTFSGLDIVPFGRSPSRLPDGPTATRDRTRYRHRYPINPIIRTAGNNQTFAPVLWDLAPASYPVDFFLYTKDNPYLAEEINVNNASESKYFDRTKPTKFIIHDYMQSSENTLISDLKDAYMNKKQDYNVVIVDWEPARRHGYTVAVTVSEYVGKQAARLIQTMKVDPKNVHVIGFGLGAHSAGVMGNDLKIHYNMTLSRITGLDPSLPLFRMAGNYFKLDPEDAAFVDVIHTDGGDNLWNSNHLGMGKELGHVDIYPNRGIFQPGCRQSSLPSYDSLMCSHTRALEIYKESVEDELSFVACRCPTYTDFAEGRCNCMHDANRIFVGEASTNSAIRGNYYLVTNESPPYGLGGKGVVPVPTRGADPGIVMQSLFNPVNGSFVQGISQIAQIFTAPIKPFLNTLVRNANSINVAVNSNHNNDNVPPNPFSNLLKQLNINANAFQNNNNPSANFNNQFNQEQEDGLNQHSGVRDNLDLTPPEPPPTHMFDQDAMIMNDGDMFNYNSRPDEPSIQFNVPPPPNY